MTVKIIGGIYRGRILKTPKGKETRPSSGLIRKAIFDICRPYLEKSEFLDLFAGSGAVGIEALSQGAHHATFVDNNALACKCIQENIALLSLESQTTLLRLPVERALEVLLKKEKSYDLIYLDPPYGKEDLIPLLSLISTSSLLKTNGHIFVEEAEKVASILAKTPLPLLQCLPIRKYGDSFLLEFISLQRAVS